MKTDDYERYVNDARTVLVCIWPDGTMEVATRPDKSATWGPPVYVERES